MSSPTADKPRLGILAVLAVVAAAEALWSAYLWWQLVQVRGGGTAVCAFGGESCAEVWDAPFAGAVHRWSGVPVAGWGVVWGLAAMGLVAGALIASCRHRSVAGAWAGGLRVLALGGLGGVVLLLAVSLAGGKLCTSCVLVYVLTAVFAFVALTLLPRPRQTRAGAAFGMVLAALAIAWAFVLLPGLRTPKASTGTRAVAQGPSQLEGFLASLDPTMASGVGASIAAYRAAPPMPQVEPRAPIGDAAAPVRITEFTDILCSHCAALQQTLEVLRRSAPPGSFSVDSRQFPLDGRCNPRLTPRSGEDVRCTGALAQICFEGHEGREEFGRSLFAHQHELTREAIFELAAPYFDRAALETCIAATETRAKLDEDLDYAWRYNPSGTPLVLVGGRMANPFGPFLYALVLAGGNAADPAFDTLPMPATTPSGH